MPIIAQNLAPQFLKNIYRNYITIQYPSSIEAKEFASIYIFQKFKLLKAITTVVNISTTQTSFSILWDNKEIQMNITAGQNSSQIWTGEEIIESGTILRFKSNVNATGSYVVITIEGEYIN